MALPPNMQDDFGEENNNQVEMHQSRGSMDESNRGSQAVSPRDPEEPIIKPEKVTGPDTGPLLKYEYLLAFKRLEYPKDKEGNDLPDEDRKVKNYQKILEKRKKIQKRLTDPETGLKIKQKERGEGDVIYVLVTASAERMEDAAERLGISLKRKEEYGGGFAPYTIAEKDTFIPDDTQAEAPEKLKAKFFFRESHRIQILNYILESPTNEAGVGLKLGQLEKKGVITRAVPLHNASTLFSLKTRWIKEFWHLEWWKQPLDDAAAYFGEELALYFAWAGEYTFFLTWLSLLGVPAFILWIIDLFLEPSNLGEWTASVYALIVTIWTTLFLEFWKRRQTVYAYKWGMENFEQTERPLATYCRSDKDWGCGPFRCCPKLSKDQKEQGLWYAGEWLDWDEQITEEIKKFVTVDNEQDNDLLDDFLRAPENFHYPLHRVTTKIIATLPIISTMVLVVVIGTVAVLSIRLLLQRTITSFGGGLVGGIINAVFIIGMNIFWAITAQIMTEWENHRTETKFNDSLILKTFTFQFVNSYTSLFYIAYAKAGTRFWDSPNDNLEDECRLQLSSPNTILWGGCGAELALQLATLLIANVVIGQALEVGIPYVIAFIKLIFQTKKEGAEDEDLKDRSDLPRYVIDYTLVPYEGTLKEYQELVLQFGFVTLFAAAFPLAPALALLNNVIEIRTDAYRFLTAINRPKPRGAQDIGIWYAILEFLSICAVITNLLMIGFLFPTVSAIVEDNTNGAGERFYLDRVRYLTLIIVVLLEHIIFAAKWGLAEYIQDSPYKIRIQKARAGFLEQTKQRYQAAKSLHKKTDWHIEEFDE